MRGHSKSVILFYIALNACWADEDDPGGDPLSNGIYCHDLDCKDMLTIDVRRRDGAVFQPGEYTISLGTDEPQVTCAIPLEGEVRYDGDTDLMDVSLNQARDLISIRFGITPQEIYMEVLLDEAIIGSEILVPDYKVITSQDPECYDTCTQGAATMLVIVESPVPA